MRCFQCFLLTYQCWQTEICSVGKLWVAAGIEQFYHKRVFDVRFFGFLRGARFVFTRPFCLCKFGSARITCRIMNC
jgi:hypothetical protein